MCQLLGMNCNTPTDVTFSFTGFAQRGGRTDHHSDGWGIAFFEGVGLRHFVDHGLVCLGCGNVNAEGLWIKIADDWDSANTERR